MRAAGAECLGRIFRVQCSKKLTAAYTNLESFLDASKVVHKIWRGKAKLKVLLDNGTITICNFGVAAEC